MSVRPVAGRPDVAPGTAPATVGELLAQLEEKHLPGNAARLAPVCIRVMLRTGVDLRDPRPDQTNDPDLIASVRACLAEMGYPL